MPLKLDLKPFERLIINGASIRNGSRRSSFVIETPSKFLRETEIIRESEADTAAKKLCVTLQLIYLSDDASDLIGLFYAQANELVTAAPSMAPYMVAIQQELEDKRYHAAIKKARDLIDYERTLIEVMRGRLSDT